MEELDGTGNGSGLETHYIHAGVDSEGSAGESGERYDGGPLREQDRFLPIANVARIMKNAIPKSGKIAKDAKECCQECVSEFISFITSEASDRCYQEKRKTINGEDILFAMSTLGFDNYVEPLKTYLQKYRESMKGSTIGDVGIQELHGDDAYPGELSLVDSSLAQGGNVVYTLSGHDGTSLTFTGQ